MTPVSLNHSLDFDFDRSRNRYFLIAYFDPAIGLHVNVQQTAEELRDGLGHCGRNSGDLKAKGGGAAGSAESRYIGGEDTVDVFYSFVDFAEIHRLPEIDIRERD